MGVGIIILMKTLGRRILVMVMVIRRGDLITAMIKKSVIMKME